MAKLNTKDDWSKEVDALFNYLMVERGLSYEEATALIRLAYIGLPEVSTSPVKEETRRN